MKKLFLLFYFFALSMLTQAQKWSELGTGNKALHANNTIQSIAIDHTGKIYVAGSFTDSTVFTKGHTYVAVWNDTSWSKLNGKGSDTLNGQVNCITLDDSGRVYAAGNFTDTSGNYYVAKWSDSLWTELGSDSMTGLNANGYIYSIVAKDSINIYAAGNFTDSNGYYYVSKWDGKQWNELGSDSANSLNANGWIFPIILDKSGFLYAAGNFTDTSGYYYVAIWNGTSWAPMGTGSNALKANGYIHAITVDNSGNVYVGGEFTDANGNQYVARWNGAKWTELGSFNANNNILTLFADPAGNVYAGGNFSDNNGNQYIAKWNGTSWSTLGTGNLALNANNSILSIAGDDWGNFYAGGSFTDASSYYYVAKWSADSNITATTKKVDFSAINIYPNPGSNLVHILVPEDGVLTIYSLVGEPIARQPISKSGVSLDVSGLSTGMYTIVFTGQNTTYTPVKWIKE